MAPLIRLPQFAGADIAVANRLTVGGFFLGGTTNVASADAIALAMWAMMLRLRVSGLGLQR